MIALERHIEILLLTNDCVIVPGLGGFMAHHIEARYDSEESLFFPPQRTLGFNPQLKINDSLLVQSYIEAYDISYPEALRRIEDEVEELRQTLDAEGYVELNGIGQLEMNDEGHLEFLPCEAGILTPSLYGLDTVAIDPIKPLAKAETVQANLVSIDDAKSKKPARSTNEHPDAIVIRMSWVRTAIATAAAIIGFVLLTTPVANSIDMPAEVHQSSVVPALHRAAPVEEEVSEEAVAEETTESEAAEETAAAEQTPQEEIAETTAEEQVVPEYTIVLASQTTARHANDFVTRLAKAGFTEAVVADNGKMVRVVYGGYATEQEAVDALRSLRRESRDFSEAWVMKNVAK